MMGAGGARGGAGTRAVMGAGGAGTRPALASYQAPAVGTYHSVLNSARPGGSSALRRALIGRCGRAESAVLSAKAIGVEGSASLPTQRVTRSRSGVSGNQRSISWQSTVHQLAINGPSAGNQRSISWQSTIHQLAIDGQSTGNRRANQGRSMGNQCSSPAQPLPMGLYMKVGRRAEARLPRLAEHLSGHDALAHDDARAPRTNVNVPVTGKPISSNQCSSVPIGTTQLESVAMNQPQSVAISRNQSQSFAIGRNQPQSFAISLLIAISRNQSQSVALTRRWSCRPQAAT